ncbi:MAG TPA: type II toxin-antitoxin system VapC family toxin [Chloroflexota bacterium]|nr:type II toxin-antitoxin system VapC family toxin [Chloroflexota bacterium]
MSAEAVYIDSSAFVKTVAREEQSESLRQFLLTCDLVVSSALLQTESTRAVTRFSPELAPLIQRRLRGVALVPVSREILLAAGSLLPANIRTLDAIHLATAALLGEELRSVITYDERMAAAAQGMGMRVDAPAE